MANVIVNMDVQLPCRPVRPLDSDCCGQGCTPCVLDLYEEEVKVWEEECRRISSGEEPEAVSANDCNDAPIDQLSLSEYRCFMIENVTPETHDTYRYRVSLPRGAKLGLKTGQHIVIRETINGECITRQYTPVSDVDATSYCELLIKVYETGRMSQCVKCWKVGNQIQIRGPYGELLYCPNKYKKVYMLAVGTGIAPMSQVAQTILNSDDDETLIELLYGCRTYADILLKSELDEWARYWNFSCTYFLTQEESPAQQTQFKYGEKIQHGRIDRAAVMATIASPHDNILVLICGTRSFEKEMISCVQDLGIAQDKYHKF